MTGLMQRAGSLLAYIMRHWLPSIFIFSLVIRLASLGAGMLWYDEAFTVAIARLPLFDMLKAIQGDVHPPLWYMIEHMIVGVFGQSEFALRLPAALFGSASVPVLHLIVTKLTGEKEARFASGLISIMPGQLYYSQEARMYSLLTLLVLLGAYAVLNRRWLLTALCCVLIVYTQNLGAVYSLILAGWAMIASKGRAWPKLTACGSAYLPWAVTAFHQLETVGKGFWIPAPANIGAGLYYLSFTTMFVRLPEVFLLHGIAAALIFTIAAIAVLWRQWIRLLPLALLAFAPPTMLYIVSVLWHPVLLDRAMLPAGAALVALWGIAFSHLPAWSLKPVAAIGAPLMIVLLITYYQDPTQQRQLNDPIPRIIAAGWRERDAMYHLSLTSLIAYDYYLPGYASFILPETGDLSQSLSDPTKQAMGIKAREFSTDDLKKKGWRRLWVFQVNTVVSSAYEIDSGEMILSEYRKIGTWQILNNKFETINLVLLEL